MTHETPMTHDNTREEDRQAWPVPAQPRCRTYSSVFHQTSYVRRDDDAA
jgi:hypothetical protein